MCAMVPRDPATDGPIVPPTPETLARAGAALRAGALIGLPTETVYGLAADATDARAVTRIFEAKDRPQFNPLIVHVAGTGDAARLGHFDAQAHALAERFWPGPLTIVVPRSADCPVADLATAGLDTIAVRVPGHEVARRVIAAAGRPLAAPSANPSGRLSPTRPDHVADTLGAAVAMVIDGGPCAEGLESTVVTALAGGIAILRPGSITRAMIEDVTGPLASHTEDPNRPMSPGQTLRHYAPRTPVRLDADGARDGEVLLAFGPMADAGPDDLNLSPTGDLREAAANLFAYLRRLDRTGARRIAVMPIPRDGLGEAINDRLRRAAT